MRAEIIAQHDATRRIGHQTGCPALTEQLAVPLSRLSYPAAEAASMLCQWESEYREANPKGDMTKHIRDAGADGIIIAAPDVEDSDVPLLHNKIAYLRLSDDGVDGATCTLRG